MPKRLLERTSELQEKISRFFSLLLPRLDAVTEDMDVPGLLPVFSQA